MIPIAFYILNIFIYSLSQVLVFCNIIFKTRYIRIKFINCGQMINCFIA